MKKLVIALVLILASAQSGNAQTSLSFSSPQNSLLANAGGAGTIGTAYAAPPGQNATLLTWTTLYSVAPASITMLLEASLDNITWYTLDTSTAVGGELRNIVTAARFFRCNISAVSGAANKTCTIIVKNTTASTTNSSSSFVGDVSASGEFYAGNGTVSLPSYSFTAEPSLGFYRPGAGFVYFTPGKGLGIGGYGVGPSLFMGSGVLGIQASNNARYGWSATTSEQGAVDTALSRISAGVLGVGTGAVGSTAGTVRAGILSTGDGTGPAPSLAFFNEPSTGFYRHAAGGISVASVTFRPLGQTIAQDGTSALPAYSFFSEPTLGFWRSSAGNVTLQGIFNATGSLVATSGSVYTPGSGNFVFNGRTTLSSPADGLMNIRNAGNTIGSQIKVDALPTISSGFGTAPSITAGSTPFAGSVNVGTGGVATGGVINFNGTAFPTAPFCVVSGQSTGAAGKIVSLSSTTQLNINSYGAFGTGDVVSWICVSAK